jgi:hypothetical protein
VHLSSNVFKKYGNIATIMATVRLYTGTLENFNKELSTVRKMLEDWWGFNINQKDIIEYAIYDTNVEHDKEWTQ